MLRVYTPCNFPAYLLALSSGILMLFGREIRQLPTSGGLFPLHMLYSCEKSVGKSGAAAGNLFMVSDESHRFDHGVNHDNTIRMLVQQAALFYLKMYNALLSCASFV